MVFYLWGDNMKSWKIIVSGLLFGVFAQIVHTLGAFIGMGYYMDEKFFCLWSNLMMPNGGAPGAAFYVWSIVFALVTGLLIALVYSFVQKSMKGKGVAKGLFYGLILILVVTIPFTLSSFLLFNMPLGLLMLWLVESVVINLIGGMIISAFNGD